MTMPVYPLLEVLDVKKRRVEQQEKIVEERREALENEKRKLKEREKERDAVLNHRNEKLAQLRREMDRETTTDKIENMKVYLEDVKEKLKIEEKKVKEQEEHVKAAEEELERAKEELKRRRLEVDKLISHRKDWEKEMRKELDVIAAREEDEIGTVIFSKQQRIKGE